MNYKHIRRKHYLIEDVYTSSPLPSDPPKTQSFPNLGLHRLALCRSHHVVLFHWSVPLSV